MGSGVSLKAGLKLFSDRLVVLSQGFFVCQNISDQILDVSFSGKAVVALADLMDESPLFGIRCGRAV